MVGLRISSKEIKDIIQVLGITDDEQGKVYLSLLSLGMATLGQISLLSGLDYLKTQEALNVLVGSKLVGRIPGKVGRYFALEPFLKSFSLGYDPITLINIRNEASNIIKSDNEKVSDNLNDTVEILRKNASDLENDFSQSMKPMVVDFNGLMDNFRTEINSNHNETLDIIGEINSNILQTKINLQKLNTQLHSSHLAKIDDLPNIFSTKVPGIRQELNYLINNSVDELKQYQNGYNSELKLYEELVRTNISRSSENFSTVLTRIQTECLEGQNAFENKIITLNSAIEVLELKANQNESKFQDIRNGYRKIDEAIRTLFSDLSAKINEIEPLLASSIDDIQKRKLFKGKEEFLANLTQVEGQKNEMKDLMNETKKYLEKIDLINSLMSETENEIVNATKNGLKDVRNLVDSEVQVLSDIFQDLKKKLNSNGQMIKEELEKQRQVIITQVNDIHKTLDQNLESLYKYLDYKESVFVTEVSQFVADIANDYKTELSSRFEENNTSRTIESNLENLLNKPEYIKTKINSELEKNLNLISNFENGFESYLAGLSAFTSNFTDVQIETFVSSLNKVQEIFNKNVVEYEKKLENELSALTFSIKEMKQKLNRVFESSRLLEYSDVDPSLLTTEIVIGEPSIIMLLRDLTIRAKSSLTVLMPRPELQTMIAASKLPMKTRISIIGDFRKVPESTLKKVLSSGNVRLKQLEPIEFWGCIRDAEELLICPEPKDPEKEELLGIFTTN
ncbi:MAG: helix-turn-helix domain-containing protein, partial [Candidatus Hodarchaeota archaeon]